VTLPLPGTGRGVVAVPAPAAGDGNWVGAPSAAADGDGFVVAYRARTAAERGAAVVVARSEDGVRLEPVATLEKGRFGAESLERPAIVRTAGGGWRLYVCAATPGSKHWWIDALDADDPAGLADADRRTVFPGDDRTGVKDPVVRRTADGWHAWICCHPLDLAGEEDRMTTAYATSADGLAWTWHGTALAPRPGTWDARGARLTALLPDGGAAYDGRASKAENFGERTGLARAGDGPGTFVAAGAEPVAGVRYLDLVAAPGGGHRLFYEAPLPDGSHELRTEHVPA
jgi:hypothetical protein